MTDGARTREDLRITIMGAGPGGLCMAIKLKEAGFENFTIVEKGQQIGGTWNWNRYPGCACDIPSHLYSFSFEDNKWEKVEVLSQERPGCRENNGVVIGDREQMYLFGGYNGSSWLNDLWRFDIDTKRL